MERVGKVEEVRKEIKASAVGEQVSSKHFTKVHLLLLRPTTKLLDIKSIFFED